MTESTRVELAKGSAFRRDAANGWAWTWQRRGRHEYRKCLTHLTNPNHLIPSMPSPTNVPPLRISGRYASGKPRRRPA